MTNGLHDIQPLVMVVDDDPSIRRSLYLLLTSAGYSVATFESGTEVLEHAQGETPACIVLDVRMPDMTGLEVRDTLARQGRETATVFITGHDDVQTGVRAMKDGAEDFLLKPFEAVDVLDAIQRAIIHDRASRLEKRRVAEIGARYEALTPREHQVCDRVVAGRLNKQIAAELGTCEQTVKVHRCRVMRKMQAESLADLVRAVDFFRQSGGSRLTEGTMGGVADHALP